MARIPILEIRHWGLGKFAADANIEALIRGTLTLPPDTYGSYSGFIYVRAFNVDIGVDYQGNPTNRVRVIVNAAGEVVYGVSSACTTHEVGRINARKADSYNLLVGASGVSRAARTPIVDSAILHR